MERVPSEYGMERMASWSCGRWEVARGRADVVGSPHWAWMNRQHRAGCDECTASGEQRSGRQGDRATWLVAFALARRWSAPCPSPVQCRSACTQQVACPLRSRPLRSPSRTRPLLALANLAEQWNGALAPPTAQEPLARVCLGLARISMDAAAAFLILRRLSALPLPHHPAHPMQL